MNTYPLFKANIIIRGKIELLTGMHIGGSKDKMEIGGVDSPVIRNPQNRLPYIPGSSIKGKLRTLLEYCLGVVDKEGKVSNDERIIRIFGISADDNREMGPTRLIVRDAIPDRKTIEMWEKMDSELLYTEYKPENTINRITAAANPRFIERVVAGSKFNFEMVFGIYKMNENDNDEIIKQDLSNLFQAMRLLEHSFLGGSGSRGYGKIKFHLLPVTVVLNQEYKNPGEKYKESLIDIDQNNNFITLDEQKLENLFDNLFNQ
jgi:CRISPR-associated protein Csm3